MPNRADERSSQSLAGDFALPLRVVQSTAMQENARDIGRRIQVVGPSCSGKSTLAEALATKLGLTFIELDALFWRPGWVEPPADEFGAALREATFGDGWVVAGSYSRHTIPAFWPRLETVIWLDFPLHVTLPRIVRRSWHRSHRRELLWGTNYERFTPQLKVWSLDSLIGYTVRRCRASRKKFLELRNDPSFAHVRWVRLTSPGQVERWLKSVEAEALVPN